MYSFSGQSTNTFLVGRGKLNLPIWGCFCEGRGKLTYLFFQLTPRTGPSMRKKGNRAAFTVVTVVTVFTHQLSLLSFRGERGKLY